MKENLLVLLIDDDADDQEFFGLVIDGNFPEVQCSFANNGRDAIEKLKASPLFIPDIIFLDINMPRMNGLECLTEIRKLSHLASTRIYMYSTTIEPVIEKKCIKSGAIGCIKKETSVKKLQRVLEEIFSLVSVK